MWENFKHNFLLLTASEEMNMRDRTKENETEREIGGGRKGEGDQSRQPDWKENLVQYLHASLLVSYGQVQWPLG